ncbi:MAG TPA: hypothetical protein VFB80_18890 [Pirellulaceae bacterium]|nr:hypothetical protein [Pirellulaceae bacterium]
MTITTGVTAHHCPECGAELRPGDGRCWLCRRDLAVDAEVVDPAPAAAAAKAAPLQFSLETLLLIVTLSAVCLGALVAAPGLGVLLLVVAVPALVRTCLTGSSFKQKSGKLTAADKVLAFVASAAITWAALMAAAMAFFTACTISVLGACAVGSAGGSSAIDQSLQTVLLWIAIIFCAATSIAAFVGMFWVTWPRATRR